jgi:hypothetical protein
MSDFMNWQTLKSLFGIIGFALFGFLLGSFSEKRFKRENSKFLLGPVFFKIVGVISGILIGVAGFL